MITQGHYPRVVAVDFDGTIVEHRYPRIGAPNIKLISALKRFQSQSDTALILWTCREGAQLDEAVNFCRDQGIKFDAVNESIPGTLSWKSRKVCADIYVDDRNCSIEDFITNG